MTGSHDDERGSEVDDYTGEMPNVDNAATAPEPDGPQPSGFGDGDVADVDDSEFDPPAAADSDADATDAGDTAEAAGPNPADFTSDELAALIAERDQYRDAAIRLQADFENFRKRTAAQASGDIDRATGRLAEALLPVLDAAEAAYVQHPDEIGPLLNQMLTELKRVGLEALDLESKPFDHEFAEAVMHQDGEGGEVVVSAVMRSGYTWKGSPLRPALVQTTD